MRLLDSERILTICLAVLTQNITVTDRRTNGTDVPISRSACLGCMLSCKRYRFFALFLEVLSNKQATDSHS